MSVIKDLQTDENGWFADGKFNSTSLFKGEMAVSIFIDDGATVEYAEKCIAHYNSLNNNIDMLLKLQEYLVRFFLYMYSEWKEMGYTMKSLMRLNLLWKAINQAGILLNIFPNQHCMFIRRKVTE